MKATVSLKQLRTDPRAYVRLLNSGYEVAITEHRKPLATAISSAPAKTNGAEVLRIIRSLPKITVLDPELDTVAALKKAKIEYLEAKYERSLRS